MTFGGSLITSDIQKCDINKRPFGFGAHHGSWLVTPFSGSPDARRGPWDLLGQKSVGGWEMLSVVPELIATPVFLGQSWQTGQIDGHGKNKGHWICFK